MDAVAPGLLLAQAIGRWGNWWNQELYGKHTTLPWGLEIHGKGPANTYHPTFLYEFLWNIVGVFLLLWIDRRFKIKRPGLFALYVSWYTLFRMYEETLRIDPSGHLWGQRTNFWVAVSRLHRQHDLLHLLAVGARSLREGAPAQAAEAEGAAAEARDDGHPARPRPVVHIPCRA